MIEIDQDEKVLKIVRRHWFVLLADALLVLFVALFPIIFLVAGHYLPIERVFAFTAEPFWVGGFLFFGWLILAWMMAWYLFTNYYLDILLVTDKRIFDIEQYGFFRRRSGAFRIDRIQNVSVEVKGIIQTLLNFGTLRIETAGEREDFVAPYIGEPYEVKKFISNLQDQYAERPQDVRLAHGPMPTGAGEQEATYGGNKTGV
jgi:uncharacterized membrane protein YdbT with pleckstrin-like domain